MPRPERIKKPDFNQGLLQMTVKRFQFVRHHRLITLLSHRHLLNRLPLARQPGHPHLVGQHLNRRRQIQRTERRVRGNVHMVMTALQLLIGQAGILTTKHQGDLRALPRLLTSRYTTLARLQHRPGNMPIPGAGAEH